jgi:glycerol-3-phosphate acyltransferase PlsY
MVQPAASLSASMSDLMKTLAALAVGYLLGSLNTSVIVGKIYGKDITAHGSRSAGLTNTLRVLGKGAAALVLAGDVAKGVVACLIGLSLGVYGPSGARTDCVSLLAAGAGAVLGHNWPVYFRFKGGKGMLTAAAVMFMIDWPMALISLGVFVAVAAASRYVSLATICAAVFFVAISFLPAFGASLYFQLFAAALAIVIVAKHRANIGRLLSGTENRLSF